MLMMAWFGGGDGGMICWELHSFNSCKTTFTHSDKNSHRFHEVLNPFATSAEKTCHDYNMLNVFGHRAFKH
jgi:hypothetical protein